MAFKNPTYPVSLAAGGNSVFQCEPMDASALISVNATAGATIRFESSADNGVADPWSPAPALRESSLTIDRSDETNVITLTNGEQYRWRVDAAMNGSFIRVVCVTGTVSIVRAASGRFFLDVPNQLVVPVGTLATSDQLKILIGQNRLIIGFLAAALEPAGTKPDFDISDKLLEGITPGLPAALDDYNP